MVDIIRCSNCGTKLNHMMDKCPKCGYQREFEVSAFTKKYTVILTSTGMNERKVTFKLAQRMGIHVTQVKELIEHLPLVVVETDNETQAKAIKNEFEKLGASAELHISESDEENKFEEIAESQKSGRFGWLTVLILLFAFLAPLISRYGDKIDEFLNTNLNIERSDSNNDFEYIYVIAARTNIKKGDRIKLEMLKKKRIAREQVPEGAVAPLNVNQLIGVEVKGFIPMGSVILMTD